jgi:hypothetical protein
LTWSLDLGHIQNYDLDTENFIQNLAQAHV